MIHSARQEQTRLLEALTKAGFAVDAATTGEEALRHAMEREYNAITLDLMLGKRGGLGVLSNIRDKGLTRRAPVIGVSMPSAIGTASFAVSNILSKPIKTDEIMSAMSPYQLAGPGRPPVMVIDDDVLALEVMRTALQSICIESVCFSDGYRALEEIDRHRPGAIVLDLMMPVVDGFAVLDALGRMPHWRDTPVIIWTSMILTDEEYAMLRNSAEAIIGKGGGELTTMLERLGRGHRAAAASPSQE